MELVAVLPAGIAEGNCSQITRSCAAGVRRAERTGLPPWNKETDGTWAAKWAQKGDDLVKEREDDTENAQKHGGGVGTALEAAGDGVQLDGTARDNGQCYDWSKSELGTP